MHTDASTQPHRGHGRALREELGVGADAHLEVLGPHLTPEEDVLDACGLCRAGTDAAKVRPHDGLDRSPRAVGQGGVAASALLDDALEQARYEGDAARLDGLQIARREEPRARGVARARGSSRRAICRP